MTMPTWISEVQACSAVLGSIAAVGIAWVGASITRQQALTARQKLRLDLFPMQYAVYTEFFDSVIAALNKPYDTTFDDTTQRLNLKLREARFLFDSEVFAYLDAIETKILQYRDGVMATRSDSFSSSSNYSQIIALKNEDQKFLVSCLKELTAWLEPYLRIQESLTFNLSNVTPKHS